MNTKREQVDRVEQALMSAPRAAGGPGPGAAWQDGVMRDIRNLPKPESESALAQFDGIVWRFVPALTVLAMLLFAYSLLPGPVDHAVPQAFFCEPAEILAMQAYGFF